MSSLLNRHQMAWRAAQDIPDGAYVNLGIGIPVLAANHIVDGREVLIQSTTFVAGACADLLVVFELLFYPQYIAFFFVTLASLTLNFMSSAALCRTLLKVGMVQLRYERLTCWSESIVSSSEHETSSDQGSVIEPACGLQGSLNEDLPVNLNRRSSNNARITRVSSFVSVEFNNRHSVLGAFSQLQLSNNALLSALDDPTQIGILSTLT